MTDRHYAWMSQDLPGDARRVLFGGTNGLSWDAITDLVDGLTEGALFCLVNFIPTDKPIYECIDSLLTLCPADLEDLGLTSVAEAIFAADPERKVRVHRDA